MGAIVGRGQHRRNRYRATPALGAGAKPAWQRRLAYSHAEGEKNNGDPLKHRSGSERHNAAFFFD